VELTLIFCAFSVHLCVSVLVYTVVEKWCDAFRQTHVPGSCQKTQKLMSAQAHSRDPPGSGPAEAAEQSTAQEDGTRQLVRQE